MGRNELTFVCAICGVGMVLSLSRLVPRSPCGISQSDDCPLVGSGRLGGSTGKYNKEIHFDAATGAYYGQGHLRSQIVMIGR